MNEPLKPWTGPEPLEEEADEGQGGYFLMAGVVCGLIIAVGSQALESHFALHPELALADPLMTRLIGAGRWFGGALAGLSLLIWAWVLVRKAKKA